MDKLYNIDLINTIDDLNYYENGVSSLKILWKGEIFIGIFAFLFFLNFWCNFLRCCKKWYFSPIRVFNKQFLIQK